MSSFYNNCESSRQLYPFDAEHLFNYPQAQQIRSFSHILMLNICVITKNSFNLVGKN